MYANIFYYFFSLTYTRVYTVNETDYLLSPQHKNYTQLSMLTTSIDTSTSLSLFEIGALLLVLRTSCCIFLFFTGKKQVYLNATIPCMDNE